MGDTVLERRWQTRHMPCLSSFSPEGTSLFLRHMGVRTETNSQQNDEIKVWAARVAGN